MKQGEEIKQKIKQKKKKKKKKQIKQTQLPACVCNAIRHTHTSVPTTRLSKAEVCKRTQAVAETQVAFLVQFQHKTLILEGPAAGECLTLSSGGGNQFWY